MAYRTTDAANEDLFELYRFGVSTFGMTVADDYLASLLDALELIAARPSLGKLRPEYEPETRVHHHKQHSIYYEPDGDDVVIIRILHGSRDWLRHL